MSIYFFNFSILIVISSIMIIISKNAITSVLYLICVFLLSSLCFLLIGAEFISILIIIIYIGAISILFLFVIMMLNLRICEIYNSLISYFPIGCILGLIFFLLLGFIIKKDLNSFITLLYSKQNNLLYYNNISSSLIYSYNNLYLIGDLLYNFYGHLLIYVAFILLLAMIGAMIITLDINYHQVHYKKINNYYKTKELKKRITFWGN